jgi:hypothetical protein
VNLRKFKERGLSVNHARSLPLINKLPNEALDLRRRAVNWPEYLESEKKGMDEEPIIPSLV